MAISYQLIVNFSLNEDSMKAKEEKFFTALRELFAREAEAGEALAGVFGGRVDPAAGFQVVRVTKWDFRENIEGLAERMYKAYHEPAMKDRARGILYRSYQIINDLKDVLNLMKILQVGEMPEQLPEMAELAGAALEEMKKVVDYTVDVDANYMKMEARCRKVYNFEERGDQLRADCLRSLLSGERPASYILYWKEILDAIEDVLDHTAGMIPLLQKIIIKEK